MDDNSNTGMIRIEIYAAGDGTQLRSVYQAKSKESVCQDKVAQLPFIPFVEQLGVITAGEWAYSQENIAAKFHLTVREFPMDGRNKRARALPYFSWFDCLKIAVNKA